MRFTVFLILPLVIAASAHGAVVTEVVAYRDGDTVMEGYLAYDDTVKGKRPGVLVIHDWMGEGEFDRDVCRKLAAMGYVAFAADIYGKGIRPQNREEAGAAAGKYRSDRGLMRSRAKAGLDVLKKSRLVERGRLAAMGYCFGGGVTLELARSGAPLAGAVSFHGNLDTPDPADARNIQGKVLVLHGADDPLVPPEQVTAFIGEMRDAGVDWQLIQYGNAVHAFTNPEAGNDNSRGAAYNEKADRRSWQAMKAFFEEVLGE